MYIREVKSLRFIENSHNTTLTFLFGAVLTDDFLIWSHFNRKLWPFWTGAVFDLGRFDHPWISRGDSARYINPWDNYLNFLRCTAEWILSFHWFHHHFRISKMTNKNYPYKRAVIWLDRTLQRLVVELIQLMRLTINVTLAKGLSLWLMSDYCKPHELNYSNYNA